MSLVPAMVVRPSLDPDTDVLAALLSVVERRAPSAGYRQVTVTTCRQVPSNGPCHDRLGWVAGPDEACGPELSVIRRQEAGAGLERCLAKGWRRS